MRPHGPPRRGAFISYARKDGEAIARELHARLAREVPDIPAWLDRHELEGGIGWWNQIEQELDRAEFLLLVMTPACLRSENTRREWHAARQRGVCVYPIKGVPDAQLDYASLPNWMRKASFVDPQAEWPRLVAHLRRGCMPVRVPFMAPPLPPQYVAREAITEAVLASLLTPDGLDPAPGVTALRGPGGFGKTSLAAAVCHDDRTLGAFDDGVLWVTLGQSPALLAELVKLYAALTGERPGFVDVDDASRELALKLENRNCLIVIDDAWNVAHVRPFLHGRGCAHLITTRKFEIALEARRIDVHPMTPDEAEQLVRVRSSAPADQHAALRSLATRLHGWPLPIKLAASAIRQRVERGEAFGRALDYIGRALDQRGITAFDQRDSPDRSDAVESTLGPSLELLDDVQRRQWAALAIFPEDHAVPIGVAARLWQLDELDAEDLARRLDDLALAELDLERGTLRLHDVLRSFMLRRIDDPAATHATLVDAWGEPQHLPDAYAWRHYAFHLRHAGRTAALRTLLLDPAWLAAKLRATDVHRLIADVALLADEPVLALLRDALRLGAPALAADPGQLGVQLAGRLMARREPEIVALLCGFAAAPRTGATAWLAPAWPTLDAPGGMLSLTLHGHARGVTALAASGGFERLASAGDDGTVCVWDLREGLLAAEVFVHLLGVRALAWGAHSETLDAAGADGRLYRIDTERGEAVARIAQDRRAFTAFAVSADGQVAVSASREHEVRVWDLFAQRVVHRLAGHHEQVSAVAITPDGRYAVSGSEDASVCLWDVPAGRLLRRLEGHAATVGAVAIDALGTRAVSGSSDRTVRLWDLADGRCLHTLVGHEAAVLSVAFAPEAGRAVSGASNHVVNLWDLEQGRLLAQLRGHGDAVTALAIDAAGRTAASASGDRSVKVWRLDAQPRSDGHDAHDGAVTALVFSPDGRWLASGGADGSIQVRDAATGRVLRTIRAHTAPVRALAFTADGSCVLSAGVGGLCWMWIVETGEGSWLPVRHHAPIDDCAFSATARYFVTSCPDRFVYLWEVPTGTLIARYGTRRLFDGLIEPTPQRLARGDDPELIDTYLDGETRFSVGAVEASRDGRRLVFSAAEVHRGSVRRREEASPGGGCLLQLDADTGELHSLRTAQAGPVGVFAVDPDGRHVLLARADRVIELWDLASQRRVGELTGHADTVNALAFLPGGRHAVSCGRDRSVRLWDLHEMRACAAFHADAPVRSLAVLPDGSGLAAGDVSGRVHRLVVGETGRAG